MSDDYKNRDRDSGGAEVGSWIFIALMLPVLSDRLKGL